MWTILLLLLEIATLIWIMLKSFLNLIFLIKDLGELTYFLGIEVIRTDSGISLNQKKYCFESPKEFGMLACKTVKTLLEANLVIKREFDLDSSDFSVNITSCKN